MDFLEGQPVLGIQDTVLISNYAYPQTQQSYDALRVKLVEAGYSIPDHALPKEGEQERDYEFFTLADIDYAECGSCESTISRQGVAVHGHQCECCHAVTSETYVKDGAIRLKFMGSEGYIGNDITFRIFDFLMPEKGEWNELVVYAAPILDEYHNDEKMSISGKACLA
jgi:hypothetical protein